MGQINSISTQQNQAIDRREEEKYEGPKQCAAISRDGIRDDMTTLANAIIAGVQRGSGEQSDNASPIHSPPIAPASNSVPTDSNKRLAPSGSVENIFGKLKKKE